MAFQFDFNNKFEGTGLKDGEYEVLIQNVVESATASGAEYIDMPLVVRNDVAQEGKNALIFHKIWKKKADGKYDVRSLNTIGYAAKMDPNKQYNSLQDVFNDLKGKPVIVRVKNEESTYNGKTYNNLNVKFWKETKFPNVQHQWRNGNASGPFNDFEGPVDISSDDLPF